MKKPNKILQEQLDQSFNMIPQSNKDALKSNFAESLARQMDIAKDPAEILVGVGSGTDLNFDSIEAMGTTYDALDAQLHQHKVACPQCKEDEPCEEAERIINTGESGWRVYTDGQVVEHENGSFEVAKDTLTIDFNIENNEFQVLKSPVIEEHGLCSLCYPNQADLHAQGNHKCYAVPKTYKLSK